MNEEILKIGEIIDSLKKRWKMILGIIFFFTLAAGLLSFFVIEPKYESKTKLFIGKQESGNVDYNSNDVIMYQKLLTTYAEIIKTEDLISRSLSNCNIDRDSEKVLDKLVVTPRADTQILEISYEDKDPNVASNVVVAITDEFVNYSKMLIQNVNVQVIQMAEIPEKPIRPKKILNIAIAFVLGIMFSFGLALLLEFMDKTFQTKEELEKTLNIPVLGIIPKIDNKKQKRKHEAKKRR